MRFKLFFCAVTLAVVLGPACDDDDSVLTPPKIDPRGEYTVTTTVASNTCVERFECDPICRIWWFGILHYEQPLFIGRYGRDLVVCPLGPLNESRIVGGTYDDGLFTYDYAQGIVISSPEPGCRLEQRWSATMTFAQGAFTGEATYDLVVVEGDPEICSAVSEHYTVPPCQTRYTFDALKCVGCTPPDCDPG